MTEPVLLPLVLAFLAGLAIGVVHLLWLWRSVQARGDGRRAAPRLLAGGLVRVALVAAAVLAVTGGAPAGVVACLAGLVMARLLLVRRLGVVG